MKRAYRSEPVAEATNSHILARVSAAREMVKWWDDAAGQFAAKGDEQASDDAARHAAHFGRIAATGVAVKGTR